VELRGAGYLYTLSLIGITFSTISALVALLRQALGGQMTNFDVYLLRTYMAPGFITAIWGIHLTGVERDWGNGTSPCQHSLP
jgi:hypothetical protein